MLPRPRTLPTGFVQPCLPMEAEAALRRAVAAQSMMGVT